MADTEYGKRHFELKGKKAEEIVRDLAFSSFLREWCYCNPAGPDGKEICDLLISFDTTLIIIQVKDIKHTGNDERYARKAYAAPLKQVLGAERRLKLLDGDLQLTSATGYQHTLDFAEYKNVHRVVLSVGDGDVLHTMIDEIDGRMVHLFDNTSEIILNELDTISDFSKYLRDKEALFSSGTLIDLRAAREIDLLADYVRQGKSFHEFDDLDLVAFVEGCWEQLTANPRYQKKQEEDHISYFWDHLIEDAGTWNIPKYREIARELSRLNRFERRYYTHAYLSAEKVLRDTDAIFRRAVAGKGTTYVFLFGSAHWDRQAARQELEATCYVARNKYLGNPKVIGIATLTSPSGVHSFDFGLFDAPNWPAEDQEQASLFQQKHRILLDPIRTRITMEEFPSEASVLPVKREPIRRTDRSPMSKVGRNDPCPCGSGMKFKKCHGR